MFFQQEESLVLPGSEPAKLRYSKIEGDSFTLISYTREGARSSPYRPGKDYELDAENGLLRRVEGSSIGDYRNSGFYGKDPFDHTQFESYGNYDFMVYATYSTRDESSPPLPQAKAQALVLNTPPLPKLRQKIAERQKIRYCVFGDSISTGAEAVPGGAAYFHRFARLLRQMGCKVELHMCAVGGDTSADGLKRFAADVLPLHADLVSIAFGMNDQNQNRLEVEKGSLNKSHHFVPWQEYSKNIDEMLGKLRETESETVLISPCEPNPRWLYASGDTSDYVNALIGLANKWGIPLADVNHLWKQELAHGKKHGDLLLNDINHPTSYGHFLYYCALAAVL